MKKWYHNLDNIQKKIINWTLIVLILIISTGSILSIIHYFTYEKDKIDNIMWFVVVFVILVFLSILTFTYWDGKKKNKNSKQ